MRENQLTQKVERKRAKAQQMKSVVQSTQAESAAVKEQMTSVSGELQRKIGESLKEALLKAKEVEGLQESKKTLEGEVKDLQSFIQQI